MAIITVEDVGHSIEKIKKSKGMLTYMNGHLRINASSLSILQQCPRKAEYALFRGLQSKHESPATIFGSAIHTAMEVFYSAPREQRILPPNMKKNLDLLSYGANVQDEDRYLVYHATKAFIDRAKPLQSLPAEDKRSIPNGVWILGHYFETFIDDPYVVYVDDLGPIVERTLEVLIHEEMGLRISVFGTIDVVLKNLATNQVLIADHKTSSMVGKDFYNRLKPNHQYSCYTLLAQECLGIKTDKFLVNCLEVKQRPKTSKGSGPNFPRQITTRSTEDIDDFKRAIVHWGKQYLEFIKSSYWPISTVDACANYGGCNFLNICSAPNSIKENIIRAEYLQGEI